MLSSHLVMALADALNGRPAQGAPPLLDDSRLGLRFDMPTPAHHDAPQQQSPAQPRCSGEMQYIPTDGSAICERN